jgi:hypothetical protein
VYEKSEIADLDARVIASLNFVVGGLGLLSGIIGGNL